MPGFEEAGNLFLFLSVYGGVVLVAFWVAMIIWAYRDMRARSRDSLAQLLVGVLVAVLTVPGLFIYLMLRPRETLSEAYERSLEEEALLQEIEEKPSCPGCGQRVQHEWQACPHCHTRLKKPCISCGRMLELSWNLCPHCATSQATYAEEAVIRDAYTPTTTTRERRGGRIRNTNTSDTPTYTPSSGSLEFVEGEDFT